jgi:hypothetical protein
MTKKIASLGVLIAPDGRVMASAGTSEFQSATDRELFIRRELAGQLASNLTYGDVREWLSGHRAEEMMQWLVREKKWRIHISNIEVLPC